jgi:hypothetical protein
VIIPSERYYQAPTPLADRDKSDKDPLVKAEDAMFDAVAERFDNETRDLAHFYSSTYNCVKINYCKRELVQALVCDDASRDLGLISELNSRVGSNYLNPVYFKGLVDFKSVCLWTTPPDIDIR